MRTDYRRGQTVSIRAGSPARRYAGVVSATVPAEMIEWSVLVAGRRDGVMDV